MKHLLQSAIQKINLCILLFLGVCLNSNAQTILAPGDLFFTGYNSVPANGQDNFSFVLLKSVAVGTSISFTDRGWYIDPNSFEYFLNGGTQDGVITWTATTSLNYGTEIYIVCEGKNALSASVGSVAGTSPQSAPTLDPGQTANYIEFNTDGDQLFAFQILPFSGLTLIAGLEMNGGFVPTLSSSTSNTNSARPTALGTAHTLVLTPELDNAKFNCPTALTSGTQAANYAALRNASNWVSQNSTYYSLPTNCTWSTAGVAHWVNNQGGVRPATVIINGNTVATAPTTYTTIQSAINATAIGDFVYITNGVYRNPAELTSTNCSLFGTAQDLNLYLNVSDKTNITITSETGNYCTSSARLVGYGFDLNGGMGITIQGLELDSVRVNAVWNSNCCSHLPSNNVSIKNNHIYNTRGHGIKTDGLEDYIRTGWQITGNLFENIGFYNGNGNCLTPFPSSALWLSNPTNFTIQNNIISNTKWAGVLCQGFSTVTIAGNRIDKTIDAGIQLGVANPGTIQNGANVNNNKITNANTGQTLHIGAITLFPNYVTGISITNNDISTSFNGIGAGISGWQNSPDTKIITNNNIYCLSPGSYGITHILRTGITGCSCGVADNLNSYNLTNNYWGASSGPNYPTNPGGTGVALRKETVPQGGVIHSLNDFGFTPFLPAPVAVNFTTLTSGSCAQQTACVNNSITPITYSTVGATGATVTGLPSGVNGSWSANQVTIHGTPLVSGVYTYTITLAGVCGDIPEQGSITVNAAPTITCPGTQTANTSSTTCDAVITYTSSSTGIPAPAMTYTLSGATTGSGSGDGSGNLFNKGTTTVTLTASNSCSSATCSFDVVVMDAAPPTIACGSDTILNVLPGTCGFDANYFILCSDYSVSNIPFAPLSDTGTVVVLGDDAISSAQNIGFNFNFYCNNYAQFYISSNGFISFGATGSGPGAQQLPNPGNPNNLIAAVWKDLFPPGAGNIKYYTSGTAPNRKLVVNYNDVPFCCNSISSLKVQIILYETSNVIEIHSTYVNSVTIATQGIENFNGTKAKVVPGRNRSNWSATNDAYRFQQSTILNAPISFVNVSDNCGTTTVTNSAIPSSFPIGTTTINYLATDASGNTATCIKNITIVDNISPSITCPLNSTQNNDIGICGAIVSFLAPVGGDNCVSLITQTAGLASGQVFPVGTTTNTFLVTDASNNTATCSFTVTVNDTQLPTISCNAPITVSNDNNVCGATVTYTVTTSDNCPNPVLTQTAGLSSGSVFPVGVTTNSFLVTDASNNTATCSFTVTVNDTTKPIIMCPTPVSVSSTSGICGAVVNYPFPTISDNCNFLSQFLTQTSSQVPVPDLSASCNSGGRHADNSYWRAYDLSTHGLSSPISIDTVHFGIGLADANGTGTTQPVTVRIWKSAGPFPASARTLMATQAVNIPDQTLSVFHVPMSSPPTFLPNEIMVLELFTPNGQSPVNNIFIIGSNTSTQTAPSYISAPPCGIPNPVDLASLGFPNMHIILNASGKSGFLSQISGLPSGSTFPVGTTTNVFVATDASGNTSSCSQTVTVTSPQMNVQGNTTSIVDGDSSPILTDHTDFGNVPVSFVRTYTIQNTGNLPLTVSSLNVTGGDAAMFTVGSLTPASPIPAGDSATFTVTFAPSSTGLKTTTLHIASDGCNAADYDFSIQGTGSCIAPTITCPANQAANTTSTTCNAVVTYASSSTGTPAPAMTYTLSGATTGSGSGDGSGTAFNKGTTTVKLYVTNPCGIDSCSFTVIVTDSTKPTITCPGYVSVNNTTGQCGAIVNYTTPVGTDNCTGVTTTQTAGLASGSFFPAGNTTNTFVVTDASGNKDSCSFTVTVTDTTKPSIVCANDTTVMANQAGCMFGGALNMPIINDNCPGVQLSGPSPAGPYALGITTVTWTATDAAGNTATCTQSVTVNNINSYSSNHTSCNTYTWAGSTYTMSGAYVRTFTNVTGCDSVHTLNLTINDSDNNVSSATACNSYTWTGTTYTTSGVYVKTFTNVYNCDSVHTLNLTINNSNNSSSSQTACNSYTWTGTTYIMSGVYVKTLTNAYNCDSVHTLNLTINYSNSGASSFTACNSYIWTGTTYTTSGVYVKTLTNAYNCDSVHTLNLTINYGNIVSSSATACNSYTWTGDTYTASGAYVKTFTNAANCDSVHTLNLTINYSTTGTISATVCNTYTWASPLGNGATYTVSGTHTHTSTNAAGCMHTETLNLLIPPGLALSVRAILGGSYHTGSGLMHDSLRVKGLIPSTEPYSGSPYLKTPIAEANGETVSSSVLGVTGPNAIVDWILLELREGNTPATVVANKRALIQRDGDIVSSTDGVSPVFFASVYNGNYYLSVKHRNHLGIMTANAITMNGCSATSIDMTTPSPVHTNISMLNAPRQLMGSLYAMWPSDANNNKNVKYNGISNDKDPVLAAIGGNSFIQSTLWNVYRVEDVNMDGKIRYNGLDNDRNVILSTVGVNTPNVVLNQHTPN